MGNAVEKRPLLTVAQPQYLPDNLVTSTAASTSLEARGVIALVTAVTSSGAPVVYTLNDNAPVGTRVSIAALTLVSSSIAPFHINAGGVSIFSAATGSTGHDMVTLATQGAAFEAVRFSTSQWLVTSVRGATFSTST